MLTASLEAEEDNVRTGYTENRTIRVDFYTFEKFYIRMVDPRWEGAEETYSNGDGAIYTVDHVNKDVRIVNYNRYVLGNVMHGVPIFLIHTFSEEKQGFRIIKKSESEQLIESLPFGVVSKK